MYFSAAFTFFMDNFMWSVKKNTFQLYQVCQVEQTQVYSGKVKVSVCVINAYHRADMDLVLQVV